jgi:hypothetical protein
MSNRDLLVIGDDGEITTNRAYYSNFLGDPFSGFGSAAPPPPWSNGDAPDPHTYVESELFVAGALSTMEPFSKYHPAWALPFARRALEATGDWEPTDG